MFYFLFLFQLIPPTNSITSGINNAGLRLFHSVLEEGEGNAVFSPYCVGSGLHSLLVGAGGDTHSQISQLLLPPHLPHLQLHKINSGLIKSTENSVLRITNKIFHHHDIKLADDFENVSKQHLDTGLIAVNFEDENLTQIIAELNSQVEKETNGKITNLLSKDVITEETRMVLVNTLYFKAVWKYKFPKHRTTDREFYLGGLSHVSVPTMQLETHLRYLETEEFQSAALQFLDSEVEMVLYKPKHGLKALLTSLLNHKELESSYQEMSYELVELNLPKFLVKSKYSLKDHLVTLGLSHLFDDRLADFSKMTATGKRELTLSQVLHNTFIAVDEDGCEAASATASVMRLTRSAPMGPEPIKLHFNVPFLYTLRDKASGVLLFVGTQSTFSGPVMDRSEL